MDTFKILFNLTSVSIFCILILISIYLNVDDEFGGRIQTKLAKVTIILICVAILLKILCLFNALNILNYNFHIALLLSELTFCFFALACYTSVNYVHLKYYTASAHSRKFQLMSIIPLTAVIIVCIISFIYYGFYDKVSTTIFTRGSQYYFNLTMYFLYLINGLFMTVKSAMIASFRTHRIESMKSVIYIIIIMLGMTIHTLYPYTSVMDIAITLALFLMFISFQESRIFNDSLTNLNNRKRSMQYLSDLISNVDTDSQFYLFIIDMNDFKRINDKFGHSEGDRSLITAATALKNAANTCRGFTARIGGDEFVLIVEKKQVHDPETIIRILKRNLNKLNISDNLQSDLSFSIGYALCDSPNKTIKQLFAEADKMLYLDKEDYHKLHNLTR